MRLHRSSVKPWAQGKGYRKRTVLDESDLGIPGSFLQEVSFRKGDIVPIHHHRVQTEVFYAVTEAVFEINGEKVTLAAWGRSGVRTRRPAWKPGDTARHEDTGSEGRVPRGRHRLVTWPMG